MAYLGILGGTFNPVHLGHLIKAQDALELFKLDRILFVPCATPPHKKALGIAAAEHRLAMLEAAIGGNPAFGISRVDVDRGGVSYSVDTLKALKQQYPQDRLVFIIGTDSLLELHTWFSVGELLGLCDFAVLARPGYDTARVRPEELNLPRGWAEVLLAQVAAGHEVGISSSEVRSRLAQGLSIRYLVPAAVEHYIERHRLYTNL